MKNGTGAVGGSVNIFTDPDFGRGLTGKAFAEYGSYHTYTGGGQANWSTRKAVSKTRVYYQRSANDYTYINKVLTNEPFRKRRQDAGYSQWNVMQEGYFRLNPYTRLTAIGWWQQGERM